MWMLDGSNITNSDSSCRKCGESGLFNEELRQAHLGHSPKCKVYFFGASKAKRLEIIAAPDLSAEEFPPQRWLVENLIPMKGVVFLGGKRGSLKTWGAMELALAITRGALFVGHFQAIKADVLYIDAENGEMQMQKRLKMLL